MLYMAELDQRGNDVFNGQFTGYFVEAASPNFTATRYSKGALSAGNLAQHVGLLRKNTIPYTMRQNSTI